MGSNLYVRRCKGCNYDRNAPNGICIPRPASDGLPLRCVGGWSKEKYYYLKRYIDAFTTATRLKWHGKIYYIDLFAGPGRSRVRDTEEEIDASPLLALNSSFPFANYFFADLDPGVLSVLSERCKSHALYRSIYFMEGDCNKIIDEIISRIPLKALSLAFIDPTGLHFNFPTVQKLATRKIDLVITFPQGMAIDRNIKKFLKKKSSPLDEWIGDEEWRNLYYKELKGERDETVEKGIIGYYGKKLEALGYQEVKMGDEILVRSTRKRLPLYCLLFACKHPLGHKLWQEIGKIEPTGQRRFY
jgi:three-Cys-motif partner protein